jgi:uncharacterized protein
MHIDRTSRRVLGSLIEKRFSTPEQYPLTLNALVLACNQKSNRDPEMHFEEFLVDGCLRQLRIDGWVTVVSREAGRAVRYAERMLDQLGLTHKEAAVLAELMLRGPQTEQELHRRCERMVPLGTPDEALAVLRAMADRGLVEHLPREVGQRQARWRHLLTPPGEADDAPRPAASADDEVRAPEPARATADVRPATAAAVVPAPSDAPSADELAELRSEVELLRVEVAELRDRVSKLDGR